MHLLLGFWQSARAIFRVRPDVVLGMGGYVAFPGGMMAALLKRPLAVHEQNAVAGLANRVLAGVADRKMVAFPEALAGAEWTGNPVRAEIAALAAPAARCEGRSGPLRLLVVGGSLGAQALNETVPKALALMAAAERPLVTHQAGERNLEALRAAYAAAKVVLIGAVTKFGDPPAWVHSPVLRWAGYPATRLLLSSPKRFRAVLRRAYHREGVLTAEVAEAYRERLLIEGLKETYCAFSTAMANGESPVLDLAGVKVPTLVMAGRHDRIVLPESAQRLVAALPDARLLMLEDSAHSAPEEEPETVAKAIREFTAHPGENQ